MSGSLGLGASQEDFGEFMALYGGPSLSQDSATGAWSPATPPSRSSSHDRSLGVPSPQRSPRNIHRTAHPHSPSSHVPIITPTPITSQGYEVAGNVVSTSWCNIPDAVEEGT